MAIKRRDIRSAQLNTDTNTARDFMLLYFHAASVYR